MNSTRRPNLQLSLGHLQQKADSRLMAVTDTTCDESALFDFVGVSFRAPSRLLPHAYAGLGREQGFFTRFTFRTETWALPQVNLWLDN